ncbi:MAG: hypothetical protein ACAH95_11600 [Fimbriimonas sp.]
MSGPWTGLSVQDGLRISEAIQLSIRSGSISGSGTDKDGDFELTGSYHERTQRVQLTRRYTYTTEPSQEGVGIPYDYDGVWDGSMVSGRWQMRMLTGRQSADHFGPLLGGPFEMWPNREEDQHELRIEIKEDVLVGSPG